MRMTDQRQTDRLRFMHSFIHRRRSGSISLSLEYAIGHARHGCVVWSDVRTYARWTDLIC